MQSRVTISVHLFIKAGLLLGLLPLVAPAQTIAITSGNGQLIKSTVISPDPLVVQVRDSLGAPLPSATVNWVLSGPGSINSTQTTTDTNGFTSISFTPFTTLPTSFSSSTITATVPASGNAVTFTETGYSTDSNNLPSATATLNSPTTAQLPLIGQPGVPGPVPIVVKVFASNGQQVGQGIPGVVVTVMANGITVPPTPGAPTIACQEGIVYTDTTGTATCTPLYGGKGAGGFSVIVGGYFGLPNPVPEFAVFPNESFTVNPGPPSMITVTGGNNQTGRPNALLPFPLVAVVADAAGTPLPGVPVTFDAVTPGTVTFSNFSAVSDAQGAVSARATLGSVAGTVQARVKVTANPAVNALFNLTSTLVVGGLSKGSGDGQTALQNSIFASNLFVTVTDTAGRPVQGAGVLFTVTQGSGAILKPNPATSDANGVASAAVQAGNTPGTLVVTASIGGQSVSFTLTILTPGPVITAQGFLNGASLQSGFISPGSIAQITGTGLAFNLQGSAVAPSILGLPLSLAGVSVTFNGISAPIFSVSNINGVQTVNVQVPVEVSIGNVAVTVTVNGGSTTIGVPVLQYSPGLFEWVQPDGHKRAIILRPDGSIVTPQNPAARGETMRMYVTGLGPHSPTVGTNQLSPLGSDPAVQASLVVGLVSSGVAVTNAIYARNLIGVDEIQWVIPSDAPSGADIPVGMAVVSNGSLIFSNPSTISIQ